MDDINVYSFATAFKPQIHLMWLTLGDNLHLHLDVQLHVESESGYNELDCECVWFQVGNIQSKMVERQRLSSSVEWQRIV